jgi:hypothetical protein
MMNDVIDHHPPHRALRSYAYTAYYQVSSLFISEGKQ